MTRSGFIMGEWQVYPDRGILSGPPGELHLEPKVMGVLVFLAERQGDVARREELLSEVWAGTIVTDEALSRVISVLRTQLGDNPRDPQYIQTIPTVGYRLLMPVRSLPDLITKAGPPRITPKRKWPVVLGIIGLVAAAYMFMGPDRDTVQPGWQGDFVSLGEWLDYLAGAGNISIAVLPFETLDDNGSKDEFGAGLTDELITSLSQVLGLKVVARRSTNSFRDRDDDLPAIARQLNVDAVIEGSLRAEGDGIRINVWLIDGTDGMVIRSVAMEIDEDELFGAVASLVTEIVGALGQHFSDIALELPVDSDPPPDNEAYRLFLMNGNLEWQQRGEQPLRRSIELYRRALEFDPEFNRAYVAQARSLILLPFYSDESMDDMFAQAEALLEGREFKDARVEGEAESVRGFIAWNRWQWLQAEAHFQRSLELAPDQPNTYQWYSQLLSNVGRVAESLEAARRAWELDEVSPQINDRLATAYLWVDDDVRAAEKFAISGSHGFNNALNPAYAVFLIRQQRFDVLSKVIDIWYWGSAGDPAWLKQNLESIFLPQYREQALDAARKAASTGPVILPRLEFGFWSLLGGMDETYAAIDRHRGGHKQFLQLEFLFTRETENFREDARFDDLARDIGWRAYWDVHGEPDYRK